MTKKELFKKYQDREFDKVLLAIKRGRIKTGKYSGMVKVSEHAKINRKEMFPSAGPKDNQTE